MEHKDTVLEEEIVKDDAQEEVVENEETTEENQENVVDIEDKLEEKKLREEMDALNDQYKRLQAEYANYRRRTQQEKETIGMFANEKILNELIPVIDSMERALEACTDKEDTMFKGSPEPLIMFKSIVSALSFILCAIAILFAFSFSATSLKKSYLIFLPTSSVPFFCSFAIFSTSALFT